MILGLLRTAPLLALAACATAPAPDDLGAFAATVVGTYDNAAQYRDSPDDLKRAPDREHDWIDRQSLTIRPVTAPAIGAHVLYVEWRDAGGAASRRRLWSFARDDGGVRLDVLNLKDATATDAGLAALRPSDLLGWGPKCGLKVTSSGRGAWNAQTDPEVCRTMSQDGREMTIDARVTVMPTGVLYQETGKLADGSFAFRMPGGTPYDFRRK